MKIFSRNDSAGSEIRCVRFNKAGNNAGMLYVLGERLHCGMCALDDKKNVRMSIALLSVVVALPLNNEM